VVVQVRALVRCECFIASGGRWPRNLRRLKMAATTPVKHTMQILNRRLQINKAFVAALMLAAWLGRGRVVNVFAQSREASEYQIKAAFLYNFAKFVEWAPEDSGKPGDPITLCIVGEDPFGNILNESIDGKTVRGRRLVIWRLKPGEDLKGCQIAFVSSAEKHHLRSILQAVNREGVLTVGESVGFAALGGVINFTLEEKKVHFEVNLDAARRANLRISSKLLTLAKIVKPQDPGGQE